VGYPALGPDGTVYAGTLEGRLFAVTPGGAKKWDVLLGGGLESSPAVAPDGTVYVGSLDGKLYAITPGGSPKWNFSTGNPVRSPAVDSDGTVYATSHYDNLYAVTPGGAKKWVFGMKGGFFPTIGPDGVIYICDYSNLYALRTTCRGPARSSWPMFLHDPQHTGRLQWPFSAGFLQLLLF
jgi:outer membrane protein assembly factor BamB